MHDTVRQFEWLRPLHGDGFTWVGQADVDSATGGGGEGRFLVAKGDVGFGIYRPLEAPISLYRELAAVELTEGGTLAFANRYGRLTQSTPGAQPPTTPEGHHWEDLNPEPFSVWREAVAWLREAVRVWDLASEGDKDGLAELFVWEDGGVSYRLSANVLSDLALAVPQRVVEQITRGVRDGMREQARRQGIAFRPGDLVRPARLWLASHIQGRLAGHVSPHLLWDDRQCRFVIGDTPNDLLGAVWLQFALALCSDSRSRQCRECGRWFDLLPGSTRNDRLTCSNSCRTKAYRARQDRARHLHEQGKSFGEIAREVGSDAKTVKGWVKRGR